MEEKHRNGLITVRYRPSIEDGRLCKIGWFKQGSNDECIIYPQKPIGAKTWPLFLEIRSHRVFREFIGLELEFQGYLTLNRHNGELRSAHITPVNLPLLATLVEKIVYQAGQISVVEIWQTTKT